MIGSFLTRGLVMVFGYAYPAYECYKTVEKNKPDIEQLRFWCQYWILVAALTFCERFGDAFISWVPMYSEAKLAFFVYLWYPKTKGTTYVYDSFFRPYVAKHENEIDRNLLELRTRAGDMAVLYWQRAASYGQTRVFDIWQYIALQSTPRPRPAQPQQNDGARQATVPNCQPADDATRPETEELPSPTSSTSSTQHQKEAADEVGPAQVPEAVPAKKAILPKANYVPSASQRATSASSVSQRTTAAASTSQKATSASSNAQKTNVASEIISQSKPTEAEGMRIDLISPPANENTNPPPKETVMEESRVTRGRSRRNRAAKNQ